MGRFKIGIIGFGKIAQDQHVPAISKSDTFAVAAVASQHGVGLDGVPTFRTHEEMFAAVPDLDAVAICTPPQVRHAIARQAVSAGKHVLLEKPPATTLTELVDLRTYAKTKKRILFATWHSQYNPAVTAAHNALAGETLKSLTVIWKEDVHRWHPGQRWIWDPGGFGVFDPGINALSIVTRIAPQTIFVKTADLVFPKNCDTPIAATVTFATAIAQEGFRAEFDWRQKGDQIWDIVLETESNRHFHLSSGGARLDIDGKLIINEPSQEYEGIYDRFAQLLRIGEGDVDEQPLRLVADVFLVGRRVVTEPFEE
jgi:D-galactose 1-dehydrogenase